MDLSVEVGLDFYTLMMLFIFFFFWDFFLLVCNLML